jgi:hypothetical protein
VVVIVPTVRVVLREGLDFVREYVPCDVSVSDSVSSWLSVTAKVGCTASIDSSAAVDKKRHITDGLLMVAERGNPDDSNRAL